MRVLPALTGAVLAAALMACGAPATVTDTADTADKEAAISKPSESAETASAEPAKKAGIGDAITLRAADDKVRIVVKPTRVITSGRPANDFTKPADGKRLYGVQFTIKNAGAEAWDDSLNAAVIDSDGQEFEASLFGEIAGLPKFGDSAVAAGDVRRGVIVFEVPKQAKITKVQVEINASFSNQSAEWLINS
jgi:ABC-type uncharacterized transport system auxiliary subunit